MGTDFLEPLKCYTIFTKCVVYKVTTNSSTFFYQCHKLAVGPVGPLSDSKVVKWFMEAYQTTWKEVF